MRGEAGGEGGVGFPGYTILLIEAVLMCAIEIAESRAGKPEAKRASDFLEFLSVERLMLFAMLGDVGDEAYNLTLSLESEDYDVAEVGLFINTCVASIGALFNKRHATSCGCTQFM